MIQRGINPEKDLSSISFLGTHDAVIEAVRSGEVAGSPSFIQPAIILNGPLPSGTTSTMNWPAQ